MTNRSKEKFVLYTRNRDKFSRGKPDYGFFPHPGKRGSTFVFMINDNHETFHNHAKYVCACGVVVGECKCNREEPKEVLKFTECTHKQKKGNAEKS